MTDRTTLLFQFKHRVLYRPGDDSLPEGWYVEMSRRTSLASDDRALWTTELYGPMPLELTGEFARQYIEHNKEVARNAIRAFGATSNEDGDGK